MCTPVYNRHNIHKLPAKVLRTCGTVTYAVLYTYFAWRFLQEFLRYPHVVINTLYYVCTTIYTQFCVVFGMLIHIVIFTLLGKVHLPHYTWG